MNKKSTTAKNFDQVFDDGGEVSEFLDLEKASRPGLNNKRVTVDFPEWMVDQLDHVARRLGVPRQSVIKVFISEKLKENSL